MTFKAPRGTKDLLPEQQPLWRHVEQTAQGVARRFGYQRIDTPMFEDAHLFVRGVGQGTDIVEKEMYVFKDRSDDELALRPEGTAPVCRAYLEHGMASLPQPVRLYYVCPIFRYERPQAGRYRQHHQFGVEAIGDADPAVDAEVIELGWRLVEQLGLKDLSLVMNGIGDKACRPAYLESLRAHYGTRLSEVCPDCKLRYEKNILRTLDCKRTDFKCQEAADTAPRIAERLCDACREHWMQLTQYIGALGIPYRVEHRLVRGLDYYTRTVFEIQPREEGAQSTILAGGRYDGLIEELGGRPTPGIGFGTGIERLVANLQRSAEGGDKQVTAPAPDTLVAYLGATAKEQALKLASELRRQGANVVLAPAGKSLKGQMRHASALGARAVLILGDEELASGTVTFKDMASGEQKRVPRAEVGEALKDLTPLHTMERGNEHGQGT
ncbi:MAG: histidine--tRNA ligase [Dehalococcoidia bacterium]|nr:histidine--tRNA ligase [Dehalococcoidia bacterium]